MDLAWDQIVSLVGAFLILLAYAMESLRPGYIKPFPFQTLNAMGSLCLLINAITNRQYGFIFLEGAWFMISIMTIAQIFFKTSSKGQAKKKR